MMKVNKEVERKYFYWFANGVLDALSDLNFMSKQEKQTLFYDTIVKEIRRLKVTKSEQQ